MSKVAVIAGAALSLAALHVMPGSGSAAEPPSATAPAPAGSAAPASQPAQPEGLQCQEKALSGSGPGFNNSQEISEEAAKKDWLAKALAIYSDANWSTAKNASMECVKQGLYSKCFATGLPCGTQPSSAAAETPKSN
jgi:hypothetical protein